MVFSEDSKITSMSASYIGIQWFNLMINSQNSIKKNSLKERSHLIAFCYFIFNIIMIITEFMNQIYFYFWHVSILTI